MNLEELYKEYPKWDKQVGSSFQDLSNKKFGRLTVLYRYYLNSGNNAKWICQCEYGEICCIRGTYLTSGKKTSCNKCSREQLALSQIKNEVGNVYGKLTVLKLVERDNGQAKWLCQCECGSQTIVYGWNLRCGQTQSCGCMLSKGENTISEILKEKNIKFQKQYTFQDCLGKRGNKYRFDFAIFDDDNKLLGLIEYDGIQHFKNSDYDSSWNTEKACQETKERDVYKTQYCKDKNIPLLRIPYTLSLKEDISKKIDEFFMNF